MFILVHHHRRRRHNHRRCLYELVGECDYESWCPVPHSIGMNQVRNYVTDDTPDKHRLIDSSLLPTPPQVTLGKKEIIEIIENRMNKLLT